MYLGNNDDDRKKARAKPKVNGENLNRVMQVYDENPSNWPAPELELLCYKVAYTKRNFFLSV